VLGGGGFRVPLVYQALLNADLDIDEIVLQDIDPARMHVIAAVLGSDGPPVRATTDLEEALEGTELIFSALRVGGTSGRVEDERRALDLGVLGQETVGAGGVRYALRAVPVADRLAARIGERAPGAWTITMTNPAGIVTEVMARHLGARVIGVCDSPTALVRRALAALGVDPGADLARISDSVSIDYLGLNHLGWLRAVGVDGVDELPGLLADEAALDRIEEGKLFGTDLIRALGALPNEYLYWYYAASEALAGVRAAGRTRGEHVHDEQTRFYAAATGDPARAAQLWAEANDERKRTYFAELRDGDRDEIDVAAGGYETMAAALAEALTGRAPATLIVNVPNRGVVAELPDDAVIEVPCRVDKTGACPLTIAPPTLHQLGLIAQVKASERAVIEAGLGGSADAALRAFALHPLVGSLQAARQLAMF
jgi:6-phospho-beta-glucosidase